MKPFIPCKLTWNGMKYRIDENRVVTRQSGPTLEQVQYCDENEAKNVRKEAARLRANRARRERESVMRSCGLVKVKGALGGIYWE